MLNFSGFTPLVETIFPLQFPVLQLPFERLQEPVEQFEVVLEQFPEAQLDELVAQLPLAQFFFLQPVRVNARNRVETRSRTRNIFPPIVLDLRFSQNDPNF